MNVLETTVEQWKQGQLVELMITDLTHEGDGVGRWNGRVVFVPDTVIGDRLVARLVRVKPQYAYGKLQTLIEESPHRIRPRCIVADKCGGCQWQQVDYAAQLTAKENQVVQALERIGGFSNPPVLPILGAETDLGYRNKATYPLGRSAIGTVQAGYYRKGSHQLINLNQCPIQDQRLNPLLAEVKQDIQAREWSIYDETRSHGRLRHLSLRIGRRTGEQLLTIVSTSPKLKGLEEQANQWLQTYPDLVGVALNINYDKTNTIFGDRTETVAGRSHIFEEIAGLRFQIEPTTFFQVFTEQAEVAIQLILDTLQLKGDETVLDAYCGVGTLTLPLAQKAQQVIGLESHQPSVQQALINAQLNDIENVQFAIGTVEELLPQLDVVPDVVVLDPPRKGCDPSVVQTLIELHPQHIVYMSCNPSTLARDLKVLCNDGHYRLTHVQPLDFFPQTAHVECVAFLVA